MGNRVPSSPTSAHRGGRHFHDRHMPWGDLHLDPNLLTDMLGHPVTAPPLHSGHVSLRQNAHPTSVQTVALRR